MAEFGPFTLGAAGLMREGRAVAIGQRGLALLAALAGADGPLDKAALMEAGWPGLAVEEGNLTVQIAALRKALGTREDGQEWIVTVPRVGYRLAGSPAERVAPSEEVRRPALAVLPFDNLSGDPSQVYFADGLVEDLITALSRFRSLAVVSRRSSFHYRGGSGDLREIARELGVRYLLEGGVRRAGDRLRITVHLAEGATGEHLWGRTFDGLVGDVFDLQDRITERVARIVAPQIRDAELERSRRKRPESLDAYDLVLRARPMLYLFDPALVAEAYRLASRAIAIDPTYALALNTAAHALQIVLLFGWPQLTTDDRALCLELSRKAVRYGQGDPEILVRHADVLVQVARDYALGLHHLRAAVEANPNNLEVRYNASIVEIHAGDLQVAIEHAEAFISVAANEPSLAAVLGALGHARLALGEYGAAIQPAERALALVGGYEPAFWILIAAHVGLNQMDEARRWLAAYLALHPNATVARVRAGQYSADPARVEVFFKGLEAAGLRES